MKPQAITFNIYNTSTKVNLTFDKKKQNKNTLIYLVYGVETATSSKMSVIDAL